MSNFVYLRLMDQKKDQAEVIVCFLKEVVNF